MRGALQACHEARDATVGVHRCLLRLELFGVLHHMQNTVYEICESTPRLLFQWARNIPGEFANRDTLTRTPVHVGMFRSR